MLRIWHGQPFRPWDRAADISDCSHKQSLLSPAFKEGKCQGKPAALAHQHTTLKPKQTQGGRWRCTRPGFGNGVLTNPRLRTQDRQACDLILCYPSWTEEPQGLSPSRAALYWGSGPLGFPVLGTVHPLSPLPPTLSANTPDYLGWSTHLPSLTITLPPRSESLGQHQ